MQKWVWPRKRKLGFGQERGKCVCPRERKMCLAKREKNRFGQKREKWARLRERKWGLAKREKNGFGQERKLNLAKGYVYKKKE